MRELRIRAGMSQTTLGEAMNVSFQQVQKYEKGANRMGASRLVQVARALGCSLTDLFEDIKNEYPATTALDSDASKVARDWARIQDHKTREVLRDVVRSLAS
jgi:transcriptional regulator with XRE-family HTH domain